MLSLNKPPSGNAAVGLGVALCAVLAAAFAPFGILVLGLVTGSLHAFLAVGLVVVYRSTHIVNFAHAEVGGAAAVLSVLLASRGWNYALAVAAGVGAALLAGALVELLVVRRFRNSPRIVLTVATIGLAQVFGFLSLILPRWLGTEVVPQTFETPLSTWTFEISPVVFDGNHVLVVVAVVLTAAGLAKLFRTSLGTGALAAAHDAERAATLGVPTNMLSTLAWVLAAGLSALAAVLQAPVIGLPIGVLVGPGLLLRGLAAAVIARMRSIPIAATAAVVLGTLEQVAFFRWGRTDVVDLALFGVILVSLLAQRPSGGRVVTASNSTWRLVSAAQSVPDNVLALPIVRWGRRMIGLVGLVAIVFVPLFLMSEAQRLLASVTIVWALVGISLVVLTGWAGQISLGQFALVGVGALVAGRMVTNLDADFFVALSAGSISGAVVAFGIGLPALRIKGLFLAVTTLGLAVAAAAFLFRIDWLVPRGVVDRPILFSHLDLESELAFYYVCLAAIVATVWIVRRVRRSPIGIAIVASRDNEQTARAFGVRPIAARSVAFAMSGFIAGLAGSLLVFAQHGMQQEQYGPEQSLSAFAMAAVGGLGSIQGVILGAMYTRGLQSYLSGPYVLLASGAGLLVLLMMLPGGLGDAFNRSWVTVLRWIAARHGLEGEYVQSVDRAESRSGQQ